MQGDILAMEVMDQTHVTAIRLPLDLGEVAEAEVVTHVGLHAHRLYHKLVEVEA